MAYRRHEFAPDEWYHCYSRGVDKRRVFTNTADYERFLQGLYLSNDTQAITRGNFQHRSHTDILRLPRTKALVLIGAYSLMPNHFHLLLKELEPGGVTKFMHKLGTGYTMYFNAKYERVGNLFVKPFRSRHIGDDRYFKRVAQYIHLNPAELFESEWKKGSVKSISKLEASLRTYRYGSFVEYCGQTRPETTIIDKDAMDLLRSDAPKINQILNEALAYYRDLPS